MPHFRIAPFPHFRYTASMTPQAPSIVQVTARGQVTLPADVRATLGIRAGDPFLVSIEAGRVVLIPAAVMPIEHYSDAREAEFETSADMTPKALAKARKRWRV